MAALVHFVGPDDVFGLGVDQHDAGFETARGACGCTVSGASAGLVPGRAAWTRRPWLPFGWGDGWHRQECLCYFSEMNEEYYERTLPHWYPAGRSIFVTWRLYGSLPSTYSRKAGTDQVKAGEEFVRFDRCLDAAHFGPVWLKEPLVAESVIAALQKGAGELGQYSLRAYVLMANHVHLLIEPQAQLATIMKGIKGVTARNANRILGRRGKVFWQDESFDHWARDDAEEARIRLYIENNPVKAGLVARAEDWPWSSAASR